MAHNAADAGSVREMERKDRDRTRIQREEMKALLENGAFRKFVWRYLGSCGVFRSSFSTDAMEMARAEGQRNVGLKLLAEINEAHPESYLVMQKESSMEEKKDE